MSTGPVFTVGHSNGSLDHLMSLLRNSSIRTIIDIRSDPHSGFVPQFNRQTLEALLPRQRISYRFLGDTLGGHPEDAALYLEDGRVNFALVEKDPAFQRAIEALVNGKLGAAPALLCKEADPLKCPRFFLIGRILSALDSDVIHIRHRDGGLETHKECESRMLTETGQGAPDLFSTHEDKLSRAYDILKHRYDHRGPPSRQRQYGST